MSEQQAGNGTAKGAKPGPAKAGKEAAEASVDTGERAGRSRSRGAGEPEGAGRPVRVGWGRYLVAPRPLALLAGGVPPVDASALFMLLEEDPEVEPVAQVRPARSRGLGAIAEPYPACPPVAVVMMPGERARALAANPQVVVELDQPLTYTPVPAGVAGVADPALAVALAEPARVMVRVKGSDGHLLEGAHVWATGCGSVAHAVTRGEGRAVLELPADTPATIRSLYVRPAGGYWPIRIENPHLAAEGETVIEATSLAQTFDGFPDRPLTGWGQQAMRLHQIPPTYRGHGIKIALIDSGTDITHPDLKDTVTAGHDFTGANGEWRTDSTGHGTWCAGVIVAADNHSGITGIAAEAELHALKLFPGGRVSDLLQALDYCVAHDIDIAQISLAYGVPSQLVAWKLMDAHAAGITVIAPAGDTAGPVAHPAALPGVLSVGAIAHTGAYPAGSPLEATRPPWPGFYPAPFTPTGPGVDLVAPGTAVITTALGDGYTPVDGTAIAAAHVTGLAALLLAHHDHLRTQNIPKTPARADRLLALLRSACRPVPGTDPLRLGTGIADAPTALGAPELWQQDHGAHPLYATAGQPYPPLTP
ncbi:S8 family serine peptidase [Streptomyces sp. NPDC059534]|uniref:S8 family serine peptidase n=1 Tax=Streptomyces sp. NPDC059534 TaxID=3346859 RepID=UPI003699066C